MYFDADQHSARDPDLRLEVQLSGRRDDKRLCIPITTVLDSDVYSDQMYNGFVAQPPGSSWSAYDFKGALVKVVVKFFALGPSVLPKRNWPRLHNLQFWTGTANKRQILAFPEIALNTQIIGLDTDPVFVQGDAQELVISFEYEIGDEFYEKHFEES